MECYERPRLKRVCLGVLEILVNWLRPALAHSSPLYEGSSCPRKVDKTSTNTGLSAPRLCFFACTPKPKRGHNSMLVATAATYKHHNFRATQADFSAMFPVASRSLIGQRALLVPRLRRQISFDLKPKAIDSAFPVTLHYYSPHRTFSLFDFKKNNTRPYSLQAAVSTWQRMASCTQASERHVVAYTRATANGPADLTIGLLMNEKRFSNGAEFHPNT